MSTKQLFGNSQDLKSIESWFNSMEYKRTEVTTKLIGKTDYKAIENTLKPNFKLK